MTNASSQRQTSKDVCGPSVQVRSTPAQAKRPPKLLRNEEIVIQRLTTTLPSAWRGLVDYMAAWLRPIGGTSRHTRA